MTADILIPVYDRFALGFPEHQAASDGSCSCGHEDGHGAHEFGRRPIAYVPFAIAATTAMQNDAHFSSYSKPELRRRLAGDGALGEAPAMALFAFDVDVPGHGDLTEEWWAVERSKLHMLLAAHPGGYVYTTAHGYRVVYAIPADEDGELPTVDCPGARDVWSASVHAWLAYVEASFGIVGDRACSDFTRLYRLPRVNRDGVDVAPLHEIGDPASLGAWTRPFVVPSHATSTHVPHVAVDDAPTEPLIAHIRAALAKHGPAISGKEGNKHTRVAWGILVNDYALDEEVARAEILRWNETCSPPWDEDELFSSQGPARSDGQTWNSPAGQKRAAWEMAEMLRAAGAGASPPPLDPAAEDDDPSAPPLTDPEFRAHMESMIARLRRRVSPEAKLDAQLLLLWKRGTHLDNDAELAKVIFAVAKHVPDNATEEQVVGSCQGLGNPENCTLLVLYRVARAKHLADVAKKQADFDEDDPPMSDEEVRDRLDVNDKGKVLASPSNINMVLRFAADVVNKLWSDEMTNKVGCEGRFEDEPEGDLGTAIRTWLSRTWKLDAKVADVSEQIGWIARKHGARNPLRSYLTTVAWDGMPRLGGGEAWIDRTGVRHTGDLSHPGWLVHYCQAEIEDLNGTDIAAYIRDIGAKWMISAVARALEPGCQVDTVLVLEGEQGAGKSSALKLLGSPWFTGSAIHIETKDAYMQVHRAWICELAELATLVRTATESQKAFISQQQDDFRPPYGREVLTFQRRCVFGGTVNPENGVVDYLKDNTGNRRWWPARVGEIDRDGLIADRDQLWAEAVVRFQRGERWWFDRVEQKVADRVTEQRRPEEPWPAMLFEWAKKTAAGQSAIGNSVRARDRWTLGEIAKGALDIDPKELHKLQSKLGNCLRSAGFVSTRQDGNAGRHRFWFHPDIIAPVQAPAVKAPN